MNRRVWPETTSHEPTSKAENCQYSGDDSYGWNKKKDLPWSRVTIFVYWSSCEHKASRNAGDVRRKALHCPLGKEFRIAF